jgi:hypothetical protein
MARPAAFRLRVVGEKVGTSAIPSFFEIKESGEVCTLSEKNLIVIF